MIAAPIDSGMLENLKKALLAGLGALDLSEDKAREFFDALVQRGELTEKEAREFVAGWRARAAEQGGRVEQLARETVQRVVDSLQLVRKSDLEKLEARILALERGAAARKTPAEDEPR
jgi:polyhydroxyalkanoate synthesis regulator phasin